MIKALKKLGFKKLLLFAVFLAIAAVIVGPVIVIVFVIFFLLQGGFIFT